MKTRSEVVIENDFIKNIKIHRNKKRFLTYAGISIFKRGIFKYLPEGKSNLLDVFYKLIGEEELAGYVVDEKIIDIGTFEGIFKSVFL